MSRQNVDDFRVPPGASCEPQKVKTIKQCVNITVNQSASRLITPQQPPIATRPAPPPARPPRRALNKYHLTLTYTHTLQPSYKVNKRFVYCEYISEIK